MGWGIDFTADIYLSRQNYNENVYAVQDEIERLEKENQSIKERMLMMVTGGASSVCIKDCEGNECDPVDVLHTRFTEMLNIYDENQTQIIDLHYYKEYLENKSEKSDK